MRLPLFHFFARDREHVVFDPIPAHLDGLDGAEHRRQRPEKKKLRPARRFDEDRHHFRQRLPIDRRHRRDDGRRENLAHSVDGIVPDVAGADREVHDLAHSHQHALQSGLMAVVFDDPHRLDDERRGDLVDLATADRAHDVLLKTSPLRLVRDDAAFLESAPQLESVAEDVPARRLQLIALPLAPRHLPRLKEGYFRPAAERDVAQPAVDAQS